MKAVILAGGRGTRLAPYTAVFPKPLMPIGERPILDIILRQLQHHGVTDVTLAVGYLAELLMAYFDSGDRVGVRIAYSREEEPLGTAGPLKLVSGLTESFLVMNGDVLTALSFSDMAKSHRASGAAATIAVYPRDVKIDLGVVEHDEQGALTKYIEKPTYHYQVSMGIYMLEPRCLNLIPNQQRFDLPDLMRQLLDQGEQVNCYRYHGYWLDIGRPDDYEKAVAEWETIQPQLLGSG